MKDLFQHVNIKRRYTDSKEAIKKRNKLEATALPTQFGKQRRGRGPKRKQSQQQGIEKEEVFSQVYFLPEFLVEPWSELRVQQDQSIGAHYFEPSCLEDPWTVVIRN